MDRNPTPVDDDGYVVDGYCSDERQDEARANVADLNPYSGIHLERRSYTHQAFGPTPVYACAACLTLLPEILAPLTSVTDLPDHPTLSIPFKSRTIAQLSDQASELMRREQHSLWKIRKLMMGFCGDSTWMPCGAFVGPNDIELFAEDLAPQERKKRPLLPETGGSSTPMVNGDKNVSVNGSSGVATGPSSDSAVEKARDTGDALMAEGSRTDTNGESRPADGSNNEKSPQGDVGTSPKDAAPGKSPEAEKSAAQEPGGSNEKTTANPEEVNEDGTDPDKTEDIGMQDADQADTANAHTAEEDANAQLQHPVPAMDPGEEVLIHPFFNPPPYPLPDRDMGLPENEAENVRHLMSLYVQKQEEIARGAAKLHEGLMKANRLRATVLQWSKAEAHVGEMSDGEDWYDKEEWRLDGDLKKGQDEEEEDTTQPVKKTRNRRQ